MEQQRTAFKIWPVLDRRHQGAGAPIRAVAVDDTGSKLYLGLEDGLLEEHAVIEAPGVVTSSLSARKHVSKKAIVGVAHLGAAAGCLAVLAEDGSVHLLDCESLRAQALPLRHVVAIAADQGPGQVPRLAFALKPSKRAVRLEVYEAPSSAESWGRRAPLAFAEVQDSSAVKELSWVGPQLVLCMGLKYILVAPGPKGGQWRELFEVPQDLAYSPVMMQPLPQLAQAMLVVGPAGIVIDGGGNPVGSALRLDALATPRALAASGAFILAACEDAVHVFDCGREGGGAEVQLLQYGPGLRPAPGQRMFAAGNPSGSCVAVAGRLLVWACLPVSPEEQTAQLLRAREYNAALELIEHGLRRGGAWAEVASAQAALCMLNDCLFEEASEALERCSPSVFQPCELFPLFPQHMQPWLAQVPRGKRYWGLHPPLQSLEAIIARRLQRSSAVSTPRSESGSTRALTTAPGRDGLSNGSQEDMSPSCRSSLEQQPQHRKVQHAQHAQQQQQQEATHGGGPWEEEAQRLRQRALRSIVQYLFIARMREGVACLEGLDSLIVNLLIDLGGVREVAAFAAVPNQVSAQAVAPRLQSKEWRHALATLWAGRGEVASALAIWRELVEEGEPSEGFGVALGPAARAAVRAAERREALDSASALLRDPSTCPEATVLSSLPWILAASPAAALSVLTARALAPQAVLPALPLDSDVRWQYLDHLVQCMGPREGGGGDGAAGMDAPGVGLNGRGSRPGSAAAAAADRVGGGPEPGPRVEFSPHARRQLHTELATQLVAAILRARPALRSPQPPPERLVLRPASWRASHGRPSSGGGPAPPALIAAGRGNGGGGSSSSSGGGSGLSGRSPSQASAAAFSIAALVSRGQSEDGEGAGPEAPLRLRLRRHLESSDEYDRQEVLAAMKGTGLHQELVVLHCQMGDHLSALRVLSLTLRDVAAAEAYAIAHLPPSEYRTLLQLLLHPGPGIPPLYEDACYLITALGDHLDPMDIVATLPPSMPLEAAAAIVAPILRDRIHRRRQGAVVTALHRAQLAAARGQRCDAEAARVLVDDERACPGCHLRIGGKVFVVMHEQQGVKGQLQGPGTPQQQRAGGRGWAAGSTGELLPPQGLGHRAQHAQQPPRQAAQAQQRDQRELRVVCYNCYRRMAARGVAVELGGESGANRTLSSSLDML